MQDCRLMGYRFESVGLDEIHIHPNAKVVHSADFRKEQTPTLTVGDCHAHTRHRAEKVRKMRGHRPTRRWK